jgi:hypothetical protein
VYRLPKHNFTFGICSVGHCRNTWVERFIGFINQTDKAFIASSQSPDILNILNILNIAQLNRLLICRQISNVGGFSSFPGLDQNATHRSTFLNLTARELELHSCTECEDGPLAARRVAKEPHAARGCDTAHTAAWASVSPHKDRWLGRIFGPIRSLVSTTSPPTTGSCPRHFFGSRAVPLLKRHFSGVLDRDGCNSDEPFRDDFAPRKLQSRRVEDGARQERMQLAGCISTQSFRYDPFLPRLLQSRVSTREIQPVDAAPHEDIDAPPAGWNPRQEFAGGTRLFTILLHYGPRS